MERFSSNIDPNPLPFEDTMDGETSGLLQFGASVDVTNDLRRTLHQETQDIVRQIKTVQDTMHLERKIHVQSNKDRVYAEQEVETLKRDASEALDTISMNEQVRRGLAGTLRTELSLVKHDDISQNEEMKDNSEATESPESSAPSSPVDVTSIYDIQKACSQRWKSFYQATQDTAALAEQVRQLVDAKTELNTRQKEVHDDIDASVRKQAEARADAQALEKEVETEVKRQKDLQMRLEAACLRVREVEKENRELEKRNAARARERAAEAADMMQRVEAHKIKERRALEVLDKNESELTAILGQTTELERQRDEFERLLNVSAQAKETFNHERALRSKAFSEMKALETRFTHAKNKLDEANRVLAKKDKEEADIEQIKQDLIEFETKQVFPCSSERIFYEKQLTKMYQKISELENDPKLSDLAVELENEKRATAEIVAKLAAGEKDIAAKETQMVELDRSLATKTEAYAKERQEWAGIIETETIELKKAQGEAKAIEATNEKRATKLLAIEWFRKVEVCRIGKKMLQKAKRKEHDIAAGKYDEREFPSDRTPV